MRFWPRKRAIAIDCGQISAVVEIIAKLDRVIWPLADLVTFCNHRMVMKGRLPGFGCWCAHTLPRRVPGSFDVIGSVVSLTSGERSNSWR